MRLLGLYEVKEYAVENVGGRTMFVKIVEKRDFKHAYVYLTTADENYLYWAATEGYSPYTHLQFHDNIKIVNELEKKIRDNLEMYITLANEAELEQNENYVSASVILSI